MRAQPAKPHVDMYKALNASASTISVGEVTSSLANGVVTGYDNTLLYAYATQWHKEVNFVTTSGHIYQAAVIVWCKPFYDSLPPDLQKVLSEIPASMTDKGRKEVRAMNKVLAKKYREAGLTVHDLSSGERAAFVKATAGVEGEFKKSTTAKGRELLETLKKNR